MILPIMVDTHKANALRTMRHDAGQDKSLMTCVEYQIPLTNLSMSELFGPNALRKFIRLFESFNTDVFVIDRAAWIVSLQGKCA